MDAPASSGMTADSLRYTLARKSEMPSDSPSCRAQTDRMRNRAETSRQGMVQSRPSRMARRALALARAASRSFGYRGKTAFGMTVAPPGYLSVTLRRRVL
ncbi:hypothetical protein D3C85_162510 [compost metagenome]